MRSVALCVLWTFLCLNLPAQRYTTVKKLPLFPEASLHTFVIHFPTEYDAYNELSEQSPWYLPMITGWKYMYTSDESKMAMYATPRYVDTLWKSTSIRREAVKIDARERNFLLMRKVVPIPEDWYGLQVFVHFSYMTAPVGVWVNGIKIGTSTTSAWGCEWNITPYLIFGRLNAILLQWDAANSPPLEMPNAWIYAFPNVAIWDFSITTTKTPKNKLILDATVLTKTFLPGIDSKFILEFKLYNRRGQEVVAMRKKGIKPAEEKWITFQSLLSEYYSWKADTPYWYTAMFVLKNMSNETVDAVKYRIGIRTIDYNESVLTINMRPWILDSLEKTNIYSIRPTYLMNYNYKWLIFDLTPRPINDDQLLKVIEKQVLTFRNYTPIVAWQISMPLNVEKKQEIIDFIRKLDASRPILWIQ